MKVTPRLVKRHKTVDYASLRNGDAFLHGGDLYVVCNIENNQGAACLSDEDYCLDDMCGSQVIPVNAEVKWSYKKKAKPVKKKKN